MTELKVYSDRLKSLANKITENASSAMDKSVRVWNFMKNIPYDIVGTGTTDPSKLLDKKSLDCAGKALLQSDLLTLSGIKNRIELLECPASTMKATMKTILKDNPSLLKVTEKLSGMFKNMEMTHVAVQSKVGDEWIRMDSTLPTSVCEKIKDDKKREDCKTFDNVSAVNECRHIGFSNEVPSSVFFTSNLLSKIGNFFGNFSFKKKKTD